MKVSQEAERIKLLLYQVISNCLCYCLPLCSLLSPLFENIMVINIALEQFTLPKAIYPCFVCFVGLYHNTG
jgi:hypothetical protein